MPLSKTLVWLAGEMVMMSVLAHWVNAFCRFSQLARLNNWAWNEQSQSDISSSQVVRPRSSSRPNLSGDRKVEPFLPWHKSRYSGDSPGTVTANLQVLDTIHVYRWLCRQAPLRMVQLLRTKTPGAKPCYNASTEHSSASCMFGRSGRQGSRPCRRRSSLRASRWNQVPSPTCFDVGKNGDQDQARKLMENAELGRAQPTSACSCVSVEN